MNLKKAAIINASGKYSVVILQLLVSAVLARILSVEDYGVVAVVTVFVTFFSTISNLGFGTAIIQNKELTRREIEDIYSCTVYVGIISMVLFCIFSPVIAYFYGDALYISVGCLLSCSLLFNILNMVPNGIMNREKRFVMIAKRTVIVYVIGAIVAIILAVVGFGFYSLVVQSILTATMTFLWNINTVKLKFYFRFKKESIRKIANYSFFQFAFNMVNYFARNLDNLFVGKFLGTSDLAYYNRAYTLMLYPVNNLTGVITPVLHPILADYQKEKDIIYKKYIKIVRLLLLLGIFASAGCFLAGREIIIIMYSEKWIDSIPCFQILSIAICTQIVNSSAGSIFQSLNNTKLLFYNGLLNSFITVFAIIYGIFVGGNIEFLAICVTVAYILHFITAFYMLIRLGFKYQFIIFLKDIYKEFIVGFIVVIAVAVYAIEISNIFYSFIMKGIYISIVMLVALTVTGEWKICLNVFQKNKRRT